MQGMTFTSKTRRKIQIRNPSIDDVSIMRDYINELSNERTFIRFQGEQVSLEEERAFLQDQLEKIKNGQAVLLLAFSENQLIGIAGIELSDKTERHIGNFGISIKKEYRGDGIGTMLMEKTLEEARKKLSGLEIVTLYFFSNNRVGLEMYRKLGFIQYGVLPRGTKFEKGYADHVMMYKPLR